LTNILFPSVRDLAVLPPAVNAINYLSNSNDVTVFSYFGNKTQFTTRTNSLFLSKSPYPKSFFRRVSAKIYTWIVFYSYLIKNAKKIDFVWLVVWDFPLIMPVLKMAGFKGKTIFQMNELNFKQFRFGKKVDHVIIPDENRAWITYFLAGLKEKPNVLPNIPYVPKSLLDINKRTELHSIKEALPNSKIILYQGTIDYQRRCLKEIFMAISNLPPEVILVIMPGNYSDEKILNQIKTDLIALNIEERVFIIKSVRAPEHLLSVNQADIGIGLYRPISLNQVYAAPNRLYEFTMFGIPQILPHFPHFKMLESKYKFGINTVDPESVIEITNSIRLLLNEENHKEGKENALKFFKHEGSFEEKFDHAWKKIIKAI